MNNRLQGKKVAVIGLGISNIAAVTYLLKQDLAQLSIFDTRLNPPYAEEVPGGIDFNLGPLNVEQLKTYDMLVVSPGLSINMPELKEAAAAGVEIVGDVELFAAEVKAPVIGITGSNGKSTVTALVGYMLEKAGRNTVLGANFGNAVFDVLSDRVEDYVLELSSFELETTSSLKLAAGVILNVSEDHLDRYDGDIEQYAAAKQRIFQHCDKIIVNREDPRTYPQTEEEKQHIFASFGLDNDPEQYGREETPTTTYLCVKGQRVLDVRDLFIYGKHNELNALAAMAIADAVGVPREVQVQALKTFSGLEHRCQLVRILDGVSFYNDSKATNVASAEAAITGLSDRHKNGIILLAGGIGKGQDFTPLKRFIGKEVDKIYCFGRDADKILALDSERCIGVLNMRQAIRMAFEGAKSGQAILLSPACSSFDQFKGFDERGRVFVNLVNNLVTRLPPVQPRITTAGHVTDTPNADHAMAGSEVAAAKVAEAVAAVAAAAEAAKNKTKHKADVLAAAAVAESVSIAATPAKTLAAVASAGDVHKVLAKAKQGANESAGKNAAAIAEAVAAEEAQDAKDAKDVKSVEQALTAGFRELDCLSPKSKGEHKKAGSSHSAAHKGNKHGSASQKNKSH